MIQCNYTLVAPFSAAILPPLRTAAVRDGYPVSTLPISRFGKSYRQVIPRHTLGKSARTTKNRADLAGRPRREYHSRTSNWPGTLACPQIINRRDHFHFVRLYTRSRCDGADWSLLLECDSPHLDRVFSLFLADLSVRDPQRRVLWARALSASSSFPRCCLVLFSSAHCWGVTSLRSSIRV